MLEALSVPLAVLSTVSCLGLAAFVLTRNLRHHVNQQYALGMAALAVMELGHAMAVHSDGEAAYIFWSKVSLAGEILLPAPWLVFSLTFGRSGSSGYLSRWRPAFIGLYGVSLTFLIVLGSGEFVAADKTLHRGGFWFSMYLLVLLTAVVANFEKTLRSANHDQQWRMKYLVLGAVGIIVSLIYTLSQSLLFSSADPHMSAVFSTVVLIGCALMAFSLIRHRLLDVDIFISRYVVYKSISVVAVGTYLLVVGLSAQAIQSLGGDVSAYMGSVFVFFCLLLLGIALLSYNARKRVKTFIDRHFFKYKYDYRKEWLELTTRLSSKATIQSSLQALADLIFETFWIKRTVLWLFDDQEREWETVQGPNDTPLRPIAWTPRMIQILKERDYPFHLDTRNSAEHELPRLDTHEREPFRAEGLAILVPLVVEHRLIGVLGLSESHAGAPLHDEDDDLMKTMAKQAATSFLHLTLAQRLVSAKELETFHAFSTFLLHDLKNFVSMLSLVVDNMGRNFDNPEFRREALISLSQTVDKMKRLMERLGGLANAPDLSYTSVDLNALVQSVLADLRPSFHAKVIESYTDIPAIRGDVERLKTVVANLILNAKEAISGTGEIHVATFTEGSMVGLSVSDTGCGMTPDFLDHRLFKPFATTKSSGFGIGLYQCKRLVEAHGGQIRVTSHVEQGSSFTCLFPATEAAR